MSAFAIPIFKRKPKPPLPAPLVSPLRHPFTWLRQRVGLTLALVIGTHIGTLVIVAVYYLLFETWAPMTNAWHNLITDSNLRHEVRNVGEGLLGGTLGQMLIYNPFKKWGKPKKLNLFDKLEIKLHLPNAKDTSSLRPWQVLLFVPIVILYAIPGFALGAWVMPHIHHAASTAATLTQHQDYFQKAVTSDWDQKVIGLFASIFLGRRPIRAYANDVQEWFAERRVCQNKPPRFYHTPVFKARYNWLASPENRISSDALTQKGWVASLMVGGVFVGLGFAGFGFYVLDYIAK